MGKERLVKLLWRMERVDIEMILLIKGSERAKSKRASIQSQCYNDPKIHTM